ncbi:hypothetical protein GCM10023159_24430 [Brevibacterium yomogidense]
MLFRARIQGTASRVCGDEAQRITDQHPARPCVRTEETEESDGRASEMSPAPKTTMSWVCTCGPSFTNCHYVAIAV